MKTDARTAADSRHLCREFHHRDSEWWLRIREIICNSYLCKKNCTHNIKKPNNNKKKDDLKFKRTKNESKHFSLGDLQVANKHRKKRSTCPVSREMQIKTKMRCYFSCTGIDFLSTSPPQVITSVDKLQRTRIVTHCCMPCKRTQPFMQDKLARSQTSKQHHHETHKW